MGVRTGSWGAVEGVGLEVGKLPKHGFGSVALLLGLRAKPGRVAVVGREVRELEESGFDVVTVDGSNPLEVVDTATWALEGEGAVLLDVRCGWTGLTVSAALRGMRYAGDVGELSERLVAVDGREGKLVDVTEVFLVWTALDELAS
ncbi:hypothetical protein [Methanopyrus kandleri]|uniref:hypothetical protein n=1 Tax=Methanopyrus kandleri TaxID=2320 RepID=UPI0011E56C21|nr:hypothetical protein [Methanopyrus kandleri]